MTRTPLLTHGRHPLQISWQKPDKKDDTHSVLQNEVALPITDQYPFGKLFMYIDVYLSKNTGGSTQ